MDARRVLIAGLAAVAVSVAACSSNTTTRGELDSAFIAKANTVCAAAVAVQSAHPFPLKSFDAQHPDPTQLPAVGDYFSRYGQGPGVASQLEALGDPPSHSDDWRDMLGLIQQVNANAAAQISADRAENVTAFASTVTRSETLAHQIDQLGTKLGFSSSDACAREFG